MSGSNWLPPYERRLIVGHVVSYRTRNEHIDHRGHLYPAGTRCRVMRSPTGQLCLLFWSLEGPSAGFEMSAVWLPAGYGLVGIEPNVCEPELENSGHLREVIADVDARVRVQVAAWAEQDAKDLQELAQPRRECAEKEDEAVSDASSEELLLDRVQEDDGEP